MKIVKGLLTLVGVIAAASPAYADGVTLEANGARAQSRWGGELGIGYTVSAGGFNFRPMAGVFVHEGNNDRYYRDEFSNGDSRCRDSVTGRFADDEKCINVAAKPYGKLEATYTIPMGPEIGGGARFSSDKVRPYGTVAFGLGPKPRIKGNLGDRYYALGLKAEF